MDLIEIEPIPSLNLQELKETACYATKECDNYYLIKAEPAARYRGACPGCRSMIYKSNGYAKDRKVHDISMGLIHVDILLRTPRYKCDNCGTTFVYPYEEIIPNTQFTKRLYELVKERALNGTFAPIAQEHGISVFTVEDILDKHGKALDADRVLVAPRVLGIDEVHIVHNFRGVFVDIENGKCLELTKTNKREDVLSTIERMSGYENIKIVTMDMSSGYRSMIQEALPYAKIIVDKYHVFQHIYKATESARKQIFAILKDRVDQEPDASKKKYLSFLLKQLGKNSYLFKFGEKKLRAKPARTSLLAELCETFDELEELWAAKEGLTQVYEMSDRAAAEHQFKTWSLVLPRGNPHYDEFYVFERTVNSWRKEIFNYFDEDGGFTNAATEGLNSVIKHINNAGRGYKFETLRIKMLYHTAASERPKYREIHKKLVQKVTTGFGNTMSGFNDVGNSLHISEVVRFGDCADIDSWLKFIERGERVF